MASVCLVTNYNYLTYLPDCLASVENQTRQFDRVIVVDDGSSDGSAEFAENACKGRANWSLIAKDNGGQLSCLNVAISHIDSTDVVYFLDADDLYPPDYLSLAHQAFDSGTDFLCCETIPFKEGIELPISTSALTQEDSIDIVISSAITRRGRAWVGSPTSALAIRGGTLMQFLPYSHESDWVTRADDVLVYGSSIVGARKRWARSLAVAYRVHGKNNFFGNPASSKDNQLRSFRLERLFNATCQRAGLNSIPSLLDTLTELRGLSPRMRRRFFTPNRFELTFSAALDCLRVLKKMF